MTDKVNFSNSKNTLLNFPYSLGNQDKNSESSESVEFSSSATITEYSVGEDDYLNLINNQISYNSNRNFHKIPEDPLFDEINLDSNNYFQIENNLKNQEIDLNKKKFIDENFFELNKKITENKIPFSVIPFDINKKLFLENFIPANSDSNLLDVKGFDSDCIKNNNIFFEENSSIPENKENLFENKNNTILNINKTIEKNKIEPKETDNKRFINSALVNTDMNLNLKEQNFSVFSESSEENSKFLNSEIEKNSKSKNFENLKNTKKRKKSYEEYITGRWTNEEHTRFLEAIFLYSNSWRKVQEHIKSRSSTQARSHAQKFFLSLKKKILEELNFPLENSSNEQKIKIFLNKYIENNFISKIYSNNLVIRNNEFNERREKLINLIHLLLISNTKNKKSFFKCIESKDLDNKSYSDKKSICEIEENKNFEEKDLMVTNKDEKFLLNKKKLKKNNHKFEENKKGNDLNDNLENFSEDLSPKENVDKFNNLEEESDILNVKNIRNNKKTFLGEKINLNNNNYNIIKNNNLQNPQILSIEENSKNYNYNNFEEKQNDKNLNNKIKKINISNKIVTLESYSINSIELNKNTGIPYTNKSLDFNFTSNQAKNEIFSNKNLNFKSTFYNNKINNEIKQNKNTNKTENFDFCNYKILEEKHEEKINKNYQNCSCNSNLFLENKIKLQNFQNYNQNLLNNIKNSQNQITKRNTDSIITTSSDPGNEIKKNQLDLEDYNFPSINGEFITNNPESKNNPNNFVSFKNLKSDILKSNSNTDENIKNINCELNKSSDNNILTNDGNNNINFLNKSSKNNPLNLNYFQINNKQKNSTNIPKITKTFNYNNPSIQLNKDNINKVFSSYSKINNINFQNFPEKKNILFYNTSTTSSDKSSDSLNINLNKDLPEKLNLKLNIPNPENENGYNYFKDSTNEVEKSKFMQTFSNRDLISTIKTQISNNNYNLEKNQPSTLPLINQENNTCPILKINNPIEKIKKINFPHINSHNNLLNKIKNKINLEQKDFNLESSDQTINQNQENNYTYDNFPSKKTKIIKIEKQKNLNNNISKNNSQNNINNKDSPTNIIPQSQNYMNHNLNNYINIVTINLCKDQNSDQKNISHDIKENHEKNFNKEIYQQEILNLCNNLNNKNFNSNNISTNNGKIKFQPNTICNNSTYPAINLNGINYNKNPYEVKDENLNFGNFKDEETGSFNKFNKPCSNKQNNSINLFDKIKNFRKESKEEFLNPFNLNFNIEEEDKVIKDNIKNDEYSIFMNNPKEEDEFLGFDNYSV